MTAIDQLLSEFIDAWTAGRRPDVDAFLARAATDADRDALADDLAAWLEVAPAPALDDAAVRAIRAEPLLAAALAAARADEARWPAVLASWRARAGLGRAELAARVAQTFGLSGQERRAEAYLEQLETGGLDPARVSRRLVDAVGAALRVAREDLEVAGAFATGLVVPPAAAAGGGAGTARFRAQDAPADLEEQLAALSRAAFIPAPDELDVLFTGGPDA